jgi:hypothetical protein
MEIKNNSSRHKLITEALDIIVKELNIEFGDFKVYVRQGKTTERIEINKSLLFNLNTH